MIGRRLALLKRHRKSYDLSPEGMEKSGACRRLPNVAPPYAAADWNLAESMVV
jgi:predicted transcriptional regulator